MNYNILETHLTFENNVLKEVAVLCENYGNVFATISTNRPMAGYHYLKDYDIPTLTLFGEVAGGGRKLTKQEQKKYFSNHK
jgi:hypothetical protein